MGTVALLTACLLFGDTGAAITADVVVIGATLYDGTGQPGIKGDLAIKDDRIVAVGSFKIANKPRIIDGTDLIIAPGFIDLHTHSDTAMTREATRANLSYLTQGVTTIVTGNCGSGPVDVAAYFKAMDEGGIGSNVIHQMPHNSIRFQVMGNANRPPTEKELAAMKKLVEKGMKDGAWGLSTGLIYNPGTYSQTDEIIELAKVAARFGGFYASHIRDEGTGVLAAIEEALLIAKMTGMRVHISHIKVSGRRVWGKSGEVIAMIRKARSEGIPVTADQYPYPASSTSLAATVIPARFREGSTKDQLARLEDPEIGPKIRQAIAQALEGRAGGQSIRIASYPPQPEWQGKDLAALAKETKKDLVDLVIEIQKRGGASIVNFSMDETDVRMFMKEPWVATASDGSSQLPGDTVPHPRSYGTYPRKIGRYAITDKIIPLEQAIRSASGLPADILKLPQRGYLKPGYYADIVIFNPKTFRDVATYDHPHQYSTGVEYLFVNGRLAIDRGRFTGTLAGRVLRHPGK